MRSAWRQAEKRGEDAAAGAKAADGWSEGRRGGLDIVGNRQVAQCASVI